MSTLDSIDAYNKYGVQPSNLRFMINNLFYMPEDYKDCLHGYYIKSHTTEEFLAEIDDGQVYDEGIPYQIVYHKTDPTKLLRRKEYTSVKMSFRLPDPIFNILPTVLVMEIRA